MLSLFSLTRALVLPSSLSFKYLTRQSQSPQRLIKYVSFECKTWSVPRRCLFSSMLTSAFGLLDRLGVTILLSNIELGVGCIATSVPAIAWSLFARRLSNHFQNPLDIEQMSLSLLEMREAEGWGLQRRESQSPLPSPIREFVNNDLDFKLSQSPLPPSSYPSVRTTSSNRNDLNYG